MKLSYIVIIISVLFLSCGRSGKENEDNKDDLEALAFTFYSDKAQLFIEFKPFVKGDTSFFAAHLTDLDTYKPIEEGALKITLSGNGADIINIASKQSSPGIYRPFIVPEATGYYRLTFEFNSSKYSEKFIVDPVEVFSDKDAASIKNANADDPDEITFLKEQAWKSDFGVTLVSKRNFDNVIRVSGEIISSQTDEIAVNTRAGGTIKFTKTLLSPGIQVRNGEEIARISGDGITSDNIKLLMTEYKNRFEKSSLDFERTKKLYQMKSVTEKEFLEVQRDFRNDSSLYYNSLNNNLNGNISIKSPSGGFLQDIYVTDGQHVESGQMIMKITKNQKLMVRADVPQSHSNILNSIFSANFKSNYSDKVYEIGYLNGDFVSVGKNIRNDFFIPVYFEFINNGEFLSGTYIEIFLKARQQKEAIVIPKSSVLEEQGRLFVYVQTGGESYEKRLIEVNGFDGINYSVSKGLEYGEWVVSKGAYYIKLSSMSGTLPIHGHAH
ncbi:MAG: efflux RND transporter periplasmic adaptor subunit [Ignavibacteria bacterium]|jgi:RND family efflux transporter MFP subunit|nr:efflux RND transporter periplasmic adaptor subunit [Ignavibacteria bacterium]